ncbi:MAG: hypothetical protein AAF596_02345 [Planctomycetota bacterium]
MATIELKTEEALVFVDFLTRFRDKEVVEFQHDAEPPMLFDLCAVFENQVPELLDEDHKSKLHKAR